MVVQDLRPYPSCVVYKINDKGLQIKLSGVKFLIYHPGLIQYVLTGSQYEL